MKGLRFTMIDGTIEHFDPVDTDALNGWDEYDEYVFYVGGYKYRIKKEDVQKYEFYPICPVCGYELTIDGCSDSCNEKF